MTRPTDTFGRHGVALVITLLMLSVVTFMTVVFLAVSRRERASVTASADLTDARLVLDAGVARAIVEAVSRTLAATNLGAFDLLVSTNFASPAGFTFQGINNTAPRVTNVGYWISAPTNINFDDAVGGKPFLGPQRENWLQNLANLQYDPRPPVFIRTNFTRQGLTGLPRDWDFRFYLDLNRNGRFDDTRLLYEALPTSTNIYQLAGDPQWVGVLEHPDLPHSETNRFIGRYAFIILPSGKSLDLNAIHNYVKLQPLPPNMLAGDGYFRNQGVASWEINLAAFLRDLNTNLWPGYVLNLDNSANSGNSFANALDVLRYRYAGTANGIASAQAAFGAGVDRFLMAGIDLYGFGNLKPTTNTGAPWAGSVNPRVLFDLEEIYDANQISPALANQFAKLRGPDPTNSTLYNRYTFYRLLGQMSVDSSPALTNELFQPDFERHPTNKFNLNFQPTVDATRRAQGVLWDPEFDWSPPSLNTTGDARNATNFFYQVADRLIRASLVTNVVVWNGNFVTNFLLGEMPVRNDFCITNIQVYHPPTTGAPYWTTNVEYTATVHRLLQLAANIYDATTTRPLPTSTGIKDYPSVFRPLFATTTNRIVRIIGFTEVTNTIPLRDNPWLNLTNLLATGTYSNVTVTGIPWVVGVKRGYPNFNEFSQESVITLGRKLELVKRSASPLTFQTNQMHVLSISNVLGVEAWNSYARAYTNALSLVVSNDFTCALSNVVGNVANLVTIANFTITNTLQITDWPGRDSTESFKVPIQTNILFITNAAYLGSRPPYLFNPYQNNVFESVLEAPRLALFMTNRLRYWLIDRSVNPPRVIDFVSMDGLNSSIDITQALIGDSAAGAGGYFSTSGVGAGQQTSIVEKDMWRTNKTSASPTAPTLGILNQMAVSVGDPRVAADVWRSHETTSIPEQKQAEIFKFARFLTDRTDTNRTAQAPYTPTRKIHQRLTWQANDPLVHYTAADLSDPVLTNPNDTSNYTSIRPPQNPLPISNLKRMNERYKPWGGNPNRQASGASAADAYAVTYKDPLVKTSDDWIFPTNKFSNVGWLGRVHRGTPWQTMYLKSHIDPVNNRSVALQDWQRWSGSFGTHPTNDWKLLELFTVAPNAAAARGLLSVNQMNIAAWSALLSGVHVTNQSALLGRALGSHYIEPSSLELQSIVAGVNRTRAQWTNRVFEHLGDVLSVPELTVRSPFVNLSQPAALPPTMRDEAVERIPQQVLSLLKTDEPRFVVYAFGQSLKPAPRSLVTSGNFYNICTNYQITGEIAAKAVLRIDDALKRPRVVVESYHVLPPY